LLLLQKGFGAGGLDVCLRSVEVAALFSLPVPALTWAMCCCSCPRSSAGRSCPGAATPANDPVFAGKGGHLSERAVNGMGINEAVSPWLCHAHGSHAIDRGATGVPPPAAPLEMLLASPSRHRVRLRPRLRYPQLGRKSTLSDLADRLGVAALDRPLLRVLPAELSGVLPRRAWGGCGWRSMR
jgi:hypothetical protein